MTKDNQDALPAVVQVPQGWKLVPVEPTPEMLMAAQEADMDHQDHEEWLEFEGDDVKRIHRAMLNAAPSPESAAQDTRPKKLKVTLQDTEADRYKRMFEAACSALGEIAEALGIDPEDGGAEPILDAIEELRAAAPEAPAQAVVQVPQITDAMALAFHRALTDGDIGQSEVDEIKTGLRAAFAAAPEAPAQGESYTYASKQATMCAECGEHKHTPLRIDAMGGYVCLTCIDRKLGSMLGEFGYPEAQAIPAPWREAVKVAHCTNSDIWNCKYCRKTATCEALNDPRNFAAAKAPAQAIPAPWREAVKVAREALQAVLEDTGIAEDDWNRAAFGKGYAALAQLDALEGGE